VSPRRRLLEFVPECASVCDPEQRPLEVVERGRGLGVRPYPDSAYRFRPHSCDFHQRGKPYAHAWIQVTWNLRWRYWGPRRALAKGKIGISTYGPAPVRVKLSRPRHRCGQTVFTKGRFKVRIRVDGRTKTFRYGVQLDKCPR
jgi:hypothetical protein